MLDWLEELRRRKDNDQMNRDKMNGRQNTTQKTRGVGAEALGNLLFPLKSGGDKILIYPPPPSLVKTNKEKPNI